MDELGEYLTKYEGKKPGFSTEPWYNRDGDCLIINFKESNNFSDRIDGFLTVFRDIETSEIVGCKIKGIKHILESGKKNTFRYVIKEYPSVMLLVMTSYYVASKNPTLVAKSDLERNECYDSVLGSVSTQVLPPLDAVC